MILDAMTQSLLSGHRIEIRGFGSFGLNYRPPRTGRNPKSGERCRCRRSTCRTSRPARSCASASTGDGEASAAPRDALPNRSARTKNACARCASSPGRSAWWCSPARRLRGEERRPVTLRFYFDLELQAPPGAGAVRFFALGALFGVLALLGTVCAPAQGDFALRKPAAGCALARDATLAMEFEYWWLLGFPLFFGLGGSRRASTSSRSCPSRARCRARISRASTSCSTSSRQGDRGLHRGG